MALAASIPLAEESSIVIYNVSGFESEFAVAPSAVMTANTPSQIIILAKAEKFFHKIRLTKAANNT